MKLGLRPANIGGWIVGMWNQLVQLESISIAACEGVMDEDKRMDLMINKRMHYAFPSSYSDCPLEILVERFEMIIEEYKPDIVHIWGTEERHSWAMVCACQNKRIESRIVVSLQGMVGKIKSEYGYNVPNAIIQKDEEQSRQWLDMGAKNEKKILENVGHVIGRTDWDYACAKEMNPLIKYHYCAEILRPLFYEENSGWKIEDSSRYSIFMSQASSPIKGIHIVLEQFVYLKKLYPKMKVYIAGENIYNERNCYQKWVVSQIKSLGLEDTIVMLGPLKESEMLSYFMKSNVFLSTSIIENSSNSICEALMVGIPVVASNVGGTSSIIRHNENGYLYPLTEPYMMSHYISSIFEGDKETLTRLSEKGKEFAQKYNSRNRNVDCQLKIYESIINQRK